MKRTRIKICGITNADDAAAAVACGVDAIGFMFYPDSRRYVDLETAASIAAALPAYVTCVGVFVDSDPQLVKLAIEKVQLDVLQFHGAETRDYCEKFSRPYYKVIAATSSEAILQQASEYPTARAIMLDTATNGQFGGTGQSFDWTIVPDLAHPLILAGGITPENVGLAVREVRPFAVDLSGGVEKSRGIKDPEKISALTRAIYQADAEIS